MWIRLPRNFKPTHSTAGLPKFPAIDVFGKPGTQVFPPERGKLVYKHFIPWDTTKRIGGWTCYLKAASGNVYFLTHFATMREREKIQLWHPIGRIAEVPHHAWEPHIHEGKHIGDYNP